MRLLLINENPFEKNNQKYFTLFSWPVFARHLAEYVENVTLLSPVKSVALDSTHRGDYFKQDRLKIVSTCVYYESFYEYYLKYFTNFLKVNKQIKSLIKTHDVILIRIPSPMISRAVRYALTFKKPLVLMVGSNITTASRAILSSNGIMKLILKGIAKLIEYQENRCARKCSLVYVYGEALKKRFCKYSKNVKLMRDAVISKKDIIYKESEINKNSVVQLITVGWLHPVKGLEYLFKAVKLLVEQNIQVFLSVIGTALDKKYENHLKQIVQNLGVEKNVIFVGRVPFENILDVYRRADIQIISSLSEGVPRVLLEGAACGLPLVCTSVGGCATLKEGEEAILVPPKDHYALAEGIKRIIQDENLRLTITKGRIKMAYKFSSEVICAEIADDLNQILKEY